MATSDFCGIRGGVLANCESRQKAQGGVKTTFWLGSVNELDTATTLANTDGSGYINSLDFLDYCGLYKFTGIKAGANGQDNINQDDDGNPFYPHTATFKMYDITPEEILNIESLGYVDLFIIYEDFNGEFPMYGLPQGMTVTNAPKSTGNQAGDSTARLLTLEGNQNKLRRMFSTGDTATTRAALTSYEVG
jgi:hypothetical protein